MNNEDAIHVSSGKQVWQNPRAHTADRAADVFFASQFLDPFMTPRRASLTQPHMQEYAERLVMSYL